MPSFDFESQFRGTIRQGYSHEPLSIRDALLITDLLPARADEVLATTRRFLGRVRALDRASWRVTTEGDLPMIPDLVASIAARPPDLIVTYRNLRDLTRLPRNSLGVYLDTLTQATATPVLVLPVRRSDDPGAVELKQRLVNTDRVMVITDHLTHDPRLIRYGAEFTENGGTLTLTHIEDEANFERLMTIISKIPEIDDALARRTIGDRLLKEARDLCETAGDDLEAHDIDIRVETYVAFGHTIPAYRELLVTREIDLLVADSKAPDRFAMSDLAYAMAIEFINIPILLL